MPVKKAKKVLLSFVGTNDSACLQGEGEGAILTALKNEKFDELILLFNNRAVKEFTFEDIAVMIKKTALGRKLVRKVDLVELPINDVTDHNEIYRILREVSAQLPRNKDIEYTAAISSGTPAMQVCWILLAESGDFSTEYPLRLIKVKDPKFGKTGNVEVKLDSALPQIIRMEREIKDLKNELLPAAKLNVKKGTLHIGKALIDLTPVEFCYYRYFIENRFEGIESENFGGIETPPGFAQKIFSFHEETFPGLDLLREDLRKAVKAGNGVAITTFRGNITKLNRKITAALTGDTVRSYFIISSEGKRGAKFYSIKAPVEKLRMER
ncbi:MAG: hypothetical protein HUU54_11090 [Ignavibacteriaceae bacterium]|nr:hypothetical protein [Ignavibacteriaceae bacterium]